MGEDPRQAHSLPKAGSTSGSRGGTGYVPPENLTRTRFLEIFFIDVDQGDSILIQTPDDRRVLIDGGQGVAAHTFIRRKYNLDKKENFIDFEAIVATHSDIDHTAGLVKILRDPKIAVRRFYHNGLFRRADEESDPGPSSTGASSGSSIRRSPTPRRL